MHQNSTEQPPYEVEAYSLEKLKEILSCRSKPQEVEAKYHCGYFERYFSTLKAKTIVVENDYIDKDFLVDYSAYYVSCYQPYQKACTRLHFFTKDFNKDDFEKVLGGSKGSLDKGILQRGYLGFIVVKPLPQTIIGRTCLKTYDPDNGRRYYPVTRLYKVHLFGLELEVRSLAYQEQDQVLAACATSALWSAFQGSDVYFQHPIPSPAQITRDANEYFPIEKRAFPNKHGLRPTQMAQAVRGIGLEPLYLEVKGNDDYVLKSVFYAYLLGQIPSLLIFHIFRSLPGGGFEFVGNHAATVTGFSLGQTSPVPHGQAGFLSRSSRIDKLYVHDDQVGPFARMGFDQQPITLSDGQGGNVTLPSLSTSWGGDAGHRAVPYAILIPLYHKIRISLTTVHSAIERFDFLINMLGLEVRKVLPAKLEWDIFLTTNNELKAEIFESSKLAFTKRKEVLTTALPRFIWRAKGLCNGKPIIDLIFDATDIEQGQLFIYAVEYDNVFAAFVRGLSQNIHILAEMDPPWISTREPIWTIFEWFRNNQ